MNRILILLFLGVNPIVFAQTQQEMNDEAYAEFKDSDKLLNDIYNTILSEYAYDTLFVLNLKKSQRIWIQFRDAEMSMKYPDYSDQSYGSIQSSCDAYYMKELTDKRIETLKNWLIGSEEGDPCSGSIRMLEEIIPGDMRLASIGKDSIVSISSNGEMEKLHRIFGYEKNDIHSPKLLLISMFTSEVEHNLFDCKYGAYYDISGMTDLRLKYVETKGDFLEIAILREREEIDRVYMLKKWFEFDGIE